MWWLQITVAAKLWRFTEALINSAGEAEFWGVAAEIKWKAQPARGCSSTRPDWQVLHHPRRGPRIYVTRGGFNNFLKQPRLGGWFLWGNLALLIVSELSPAPSRGALIPKLLFNTYRPIGEGMNFIFPGFPLDLCRLGQERRIHSRVSLDVLQENIYVPGKLWIFFLEFWCGFRSNYE